MTSISRILLLGLILASGSICVAQKHFMFEQRRPFKHPVKLPTGALQLLRHEISDKRGCSLNETTDISRWFIASRIDLGANRLAYIARSYEDCLNGVDNDWFWIILKTRRGYRLLLYNGTISLTVRRTRTRGFPDIESNIGTGAGMYTDIYKFDGTVYRVDSCWFTDGLTNKRRRSPCHA